MTWLSRSLAAISIAVSVLGLLAAVVLADQARPGSVGASAPAGQTFRTGWGEPDLQGIWSARTLTPLERPARWADRAILTPEEEAAVVKWVYSSVGRDDRSKRGTERDVAGAYNEFWNIGPVHSLADRRTALIIDPEDGRIPPMTAEGRQRTEVMREYVAALLDGTAGGRPGRGLSPRRNEPPPMYNAGRLNRADGPEDRSPEGRCMGVSMPNFSAARYGVYYRIVQSPGQVGIIHDSNQGQGFMRVIPVDGSPHPPAQLRFLQGDSRGRWEGDTLVVSVANFTHKRDFYGSRENLRLTERFTRVSANRINYRVTVEDPMTWTRPWTFEVPWGRESDRANQVYESNCHEGNFGLIGILANTRAAEERFRRGEGPDPATEDNATGGGTGQPHTLANFPRSDDRRLRH